MRKIVIRNLLIHIAVNICNPPTFSINKLKSWVPHAYYYISSSILNCFVFSYLSAFQRTQIVPTPVWPGKTRATRVTRKTQGRDITVIIIIIK